MVARPYHLISGADHLLLFLSLPLVQLVARLIGPTRSGIEASPLLSYSLLLPLRCV